MSYFKTNMHQKIRFQLALCADPARRAYSDPSDPLAGFKGPKSKGGGGKERIGRDGSGRNLRGP